MSPSELCFMNLKHIVIPCKLNFVGGQENITQASNMIAQGGNNQNTTTDVGNGNTMDASNNTVTTPAANGKYTCILTSHFS